MRKLLLVLFVKPFLHFLCKVLNDLHDFMEDFGGFSFNSHRAVLGK